MRRLILAIFLTLILPALAIAQSQPSSPETATARAQEILKLARESLGGDANLSAIKSLQINGNFKTAMQGREIQGDLKVEVLMPDKFLRTAKINMGPVEVTRVEAVNGDQAWTDLKTATLTAGGGPGGGPGGGMDGMAGGGMGGPGGGTGGGVEGAGGGMGGPGGGMGGGGMGGRGRGGGAGGPGGMPGGRSPGMGGPGGIVNASPEAQAAMERQVRADFNRFLVGVLLAPGGSSQFTYSFDREMETKEGKADLLGVMGPDGFAVLLLIDQKSHRPWMVNYRAPAPRGPRPQPAEQDETGEPKMIDVQVFFADHKQVGNVWLPHRIVKSTDGRIIEEWKVSKYKLNPEIKANRFEKKK